MLFTKLFTILMMSEKIATPDLLKLKFSCNQVNDVIISVYDVNNKIILRGLNYIVNVPMWPKAGKPSISMREVTLTSAV